MNIYKQRKGLNLSEIAKDVLKNWEENQTFEKSISKRADGPSFVFYEGPPSSNGLPGIHHVMRTFLRQI